MEDDEKEIIFIALSNSIMMYNNSLEETQNEEERELISYIIDRHEQILDKYHSDILNSDEPLTIKRPSWD